MLCRRVSEWHVKEFQILYLQKKTDISLDNSRFQA
jgi:hypothetical protein